MKFILNPSLKCSLHQQCHTGLLTSQSDVQDGAADYSTAGLSSFKMWLLIHLKSEIKLLRVFMDVCVCFHLILQSSLSHLYTLMLSFIYVRIYLCVTHLHKDLLIYQYVWAYIHT